MIEVNKVLSDKANQERIDFFAAAYRVYSEGGSFKIIKGKVVYFSPKNTIKKGDELVEKAKQVSTTS